MSQPLPAVVPSGDLAPSPDISLIPALIADAGEQAGWRYVEFFTANIRNPNTRRAYARACSQFFAWCDERSLTLITIRSFDVASYSENRQQTHSAPDVKQQIAAIRMLFDWLGVEEVAVDYDEALDLAAATGLTAYDASYLWLARQLGAELVTLDRQLAKAEAAPHP